MDIKCWQWFACVWQSTRGHGQVWLPDSGCQHLSHWSSGGFRYWTLLRCLQCRCVTDQQVPQKITSSVCEMLRDFVKGLSTNTLSAAVSLINRSGLCYSTFIVLFSDTFHAALLLINRRVRKSLSQSVKLWRRTLLMLWDCSDAISAPVSVVIREVWSDADTLWAFLL